MISNFDFDCKSSVDLFNINLIDNVSNQKNDDAWFQVHHPLHEIQNKLDSPVKPEEPSASTSMSKPMPKSVASNRQPVMKTAPMRTQVVSKKRSATEMNMSATSQTQTKAKNIHKGAAASTANSRAATQESKLKEQEKESSFSLQPSKRPKTSQVKVFMEPTRKPNVKSKIAVENSIKRAGPFSKPAPSKSQTVLTKTKPAPSKSQSQPQPQKIDTKKLTPHKKAKAYDEQKKAEAEAEQVAAYKDLLAKSAGTASSSSSSSSSIKVKAKTLSVEDTRKWEKSSRKMYSQLTSAEREKANIEIANM